LIAEKNKSRTHIHGRNYRNFCRRFPKWRGNFLAPQKSIYRKNIDSTRVFPKIFSGITPNRHLKPKMIKNRQKHPKNHDFSAFSAVFAPNPQK